MSQYDTLAADHFVGVVGGGCALGGEVVWWGSRLPQVAHWEVWVALVEMWW